MFLLAFFFVSLCRYAFVHWVIPLDDLAFEVSRLSCCQVARS